VDEAYRGVELSAVVLVAALIPLQLALVNTHAAELLADTLLHTFEPLGPRGILAALCVMTSLGSQAIPAPALVVLMAPIAITAAETAGLSPHALIMGVALSASGLASPVGHPANALIMGPGGYRYMDYLKVGLPLTIVVLLLVIFVMPVVWPL
jgi:di/tricarboxylate transporter